MEKKVKKNQTGEKIKKNIIGFLDRRKHTARENIRLAAIVSTVVFVIGIFCPMLGANMKFSMVDSSKTDGSAETVIFQPNEDIINISAKDFIFQKPLRNYAIFGQEIGAVEILGINIYDTLTSPAPNFDGLKSAEEFLNSGTLGFLVDENFVKFCTENLGDFGKVLIEIGKVVNEVAGQVGKVLTNINGTLANVSAASESVRESIKQTENALNIVNIIVAIVFVAILAMMLIVILQKKPNYAPAIILTVFSVVFVAIGIFSLIANSMIDSAINSGVNELSTSVEGLLNGLIPGASAALAQLISASQIRFVLNISVFCGAGWWLMTITLIATTVLAYVKNHLAKKELKAVEAEEVAKRAVAEAKKELKKANKE